MPQRGYRRWHLKKSQRASAVRRQLIELLGGRCVGKDGKCGKRYIAILQIDHVDGCTWDQRTLNRADRQFKYMREYEAGVRLRVLCSSCNKTHLPQRSPPRTETTDVERELEDAPF